MSLGGGACGEALLTSCGDQQPFIQTTLEALAQGDSVHLHLAAGPLSFPFANQANEVTNALRAPKYFIDEHRVNNLAPSLPWQS